jgi:hypothetical protein
MRRALAAHAEGDSVLIFRWQLNCLRASVPAVRHSFSQREGRALRQAPAAIATPGKVSYAQLWIMPGPTSLTVMLIPP